MSAPRHTPAVQTHFRCEAVRSAASVLPTSAGELLIVTEAYVPFPILPPFVHLLQATDEDSPPNNFLVYTITSASAFPDYFSVVMVEGYAGMHIFSSTMDDVMYEHIACCSASVIGDQSLPSASTSDQRAQASGL